MEILRWGILGANWIADRVSTAIEGTEGGALHAVAARTDAHMADFAKKHGLSRLYHSCEELAADPELDAIYISTPHGLHAEHARICLAAGKHVLCEKPFAMSEAQAQELYALADAQGLFIMEAMWTRFLPSIRAIEALYKGGALGEPLLMAHEFCGRLDLEGTDARHLNPALGGGALLDLGVYSLTLMDIFMPRVKTLHSIAHKGSTGVDVRNATQVLHEGGAISTLVTAFDLSTASHTTLHATEGSISFHPCFAPQSYTVTRQGQENTLQAPFRINGYEYQLEAFYDAVAHGKKEPALLLREDTLRIQRMMDAMLKTY